MKRREFAKSAAAAAVIGALPWSAQSEPEPRPPSKQGNAPGSRGEELLKMAEAHQEEMVKALRAKPLPYDLEPAFVFAARPRERKNRR